MEDAPTPFAELDNGPSKFEEFLENNQKLLIGGSIAIFLGVLGYVGYTGYNDLKAQEAGSALSAASDEATIQTVISTYGDTATAGSATLLLAGEQASESDEKAIETLSSFIDTYPTHPALASATTKLGLALLNKGDLAGAQARLSAVVDMEDADYIIPAAQIGLGDIAKANGDISQAKELYTKVSDLTAGGFDSIQKYSQYAAIANSRLRYLEAAAPEEKAAQSAPAATPAPQPTISTTLESDDKSELPSE